MCVLWPSLQGAHVGAMASAGDLLAFFLIVCSLSALRAASDGNETAVAALTRLVRRVLDPEVYDNRVMPVPETNSPVSVEFGLWLKQILDVDVTKGTVKVVVWENMRYEDHRLAWNETEFPHILDLRIPAFELWIPDVTILNSADDYTHGIDRHSSSDISLHSSGTVSLLTIVVHTFACEFDLRNFPFDEHICKLEFGSWTRSLTQMHIETPSETIDTDNFIPNPIWDLTNTSVKRNSWNYECCPEMQWEDYDFALHLRRRSSFYGWMYFAPMALLQLLLPALFIMPVNTAHRYILGGSVLVSLTLMITNLDIIIPWSGGTVPIIGRYYIGVHVLISLALGLSALITNVANKPMEATPLPHIVKRVLFDVLARALCMGTVNAATPTDDINGEGGKTTVRASQEWNQLAHVLDRLFLVLFIISDIIVFLSFI